MDWQTRSTSEGYQPNFLAAGHWKRTTYFYNSSCKADWSTSTHDEQLDTITRLFKASKVNSGLRYLRGFLNMHGVRVQRRRVIESLQRVDRLGRVIRHRRLIERQPYKVSRPNALWHIDGYLLGARCSIPRRHQRRRLRAFSPKNVVDKLL
ncbi:hypothetical protein C8R42DRAFT_665702, partial [Lentinula raphanica]